MQTKEKDHIKVNDMSDKKTPPCNPHKERREEAPGDGDFDE